VPFESDVVVREIDAEPVNMPHAMLPTSRRRAGA
jgi:hypothetical protein